MVLKFLRNLHDGALLVSLYLAAALVALMAVLGAADAVSSGVFSTPVAGTQELSQILLPTAFFLVLGKVQQQRDHIVVDIVSGAFRPSIRQRLAQLGTLVGAIVLGLVAWRFWINAIEAVHILQRANAAIYIPVYPFKIACAFGATLATIECLRQTIAPPRVTHRSDEEPHLEASQI